MGEGLRRPRANFAGKPTHTHGVSTTTNVMYERCNLQPYAHPLPPSPSVLQHRDTEDNLDATPLFDFTIDNYRKVDAIMSRYPENFKKSGIIPLLDLGQRQNDNFCSLAVMKKVAAICEVSDMEVYEVATFYTMFNKSVNQCSGAVG